MVRMARLGDTTAKSLTAPPPGNWPVDGLRGYSAAATSDQCIPPSCEARSCLRWKLVVGWPPQMSQSCPPPVVRRSYSPHSLVRGWGNACQLAPRPATAAAFIWAIPPPPPPHTPAGRDL